MAQKLSELLLDSDIEYDVHPKVLAELFNIAGWRFLRTGKEFDSAVSGKDIHQTLESLRDSALEGFYDGVHATARLAVERNTEKIGGVDMITLTYYVQVGTEFIEGKANPWVQDKLFNGTGGYL